MSRSSVKQIEEDEQIIIQELMKDSRQSPQEIAEHCRFSRQKVWRIMNKLEENNKVWGYTAVVDDDNVGRKTYFALLKAKAPFHDKIDLIIKNIKDQKKGLETKHNIYLLGSYYLNGVYDWLVIFSAENISHAKRYQGAAQKEYGEFLERIDLMESVFPLIKFGKINPNIEQLKEFAIE